MKTEPLAKLSLPARVPVTGRPPPGVLTASFTASGLTTRLAVAVAQLAGAALSQKRYNSDSGPAAAVAGTTRVPSGLIEKPLGAPTRLSVTPACGTALPAKVSLTSTLGVVPPAPGGSGVAKVSSLATSTLALTSTDAVAIEQTLPLGAGRQTW
ncbi:hypothetical protein [Stenotrophomonas cyclobalanopsidis]|uniref:hypothetical protein n=1 Tax=Stenotrophomonas cyclobalanopsidis TaxID=2771362 RepID=UPI00346155CB